MVLLLSIEGKLNLVAEYHNSVINLIHMMIYPVHSSSALTYFSSWSTEEPGGDFVREWEQRTRYREVQIEIQSQLGGL